MHAKCTMKCQLTHLPPHKNKSAVNSMQLFPEGEVISGGYLSIIPRARMGSESLRGHEGERNNCFSKIQLVGHKYQK